MNDIARRLFPEKAALFDNKQCTNCKKVIKGALEFRDSLSEKEYNFSGLCQLCQDDTFSEIIIG